MVSYMAVREGAGFGELDMMGEIAVNIRPPDGVVPVGETTGGVSEGILGEILVIYQDLPCG